MAPPQNLLLFGATGAIGSFILDAILSARDQFGRIVIFTSARTAEAKAAYLNGLKTQKNVEVIVGNVEDGNAVKAAYEGMYHKTV
jgi:FlaA1/EpsC-like NDP-sugar epimerase